MELIVLMVIGAILVLIGVNKFGRKDYAQNQGYFETKIAAHVAEAHTRHIQAETQLKQAQHEHQNLPNQWAEEGLAQRTRMEQLRACFKSPRSVLVT